MAQYRPACGETPDAMAKAIAQRQRNEPYGHTGDQIGEEFVAVVAAQQEYRFREPSFECGCHAAFGPE